MRRALAKSLGAVEERFVISVKTDNAGTSADNEFTLPWIGTYDVDWGDGNTDTSVVDTQTHTYASAGTYDVKVTAETGQIFFARGNNDRNKLLDITNWGTCAWTTMDRAFQGCENLQGVSALDIPNFTNCTHINGMFSNSAYYTPGEITNISNWNISNITNLNDTFNNWKRFNNIPIGNTFNLSDWDFSNVTTLRGFIGSNATLNYAILDCTNINLSSLTDGYFAFPRVKMSNLDKMILGSTLPSLGILQDNTLGGLDVSSTTNFYTSFRSVNLENQDLSGWDVSSVTQFRETFLGASNIPDISMWDVSSATTMQSMFQYSDIDQDLGSWNIENVSNFNSFMVGVTLSTPNYDATLVGWAAQTPRLNQSVGFGNSQYTYEAASARQTLIDTYGWTITDGGQVASPEFVISVKTDNAGTSADNEFTIPTNGSGYNYDIEYDGQTLTGQTGSVTLTFPSGAGTYDIKISGSFPQCYFNNGGDKAKLLDIKNFGIYALGSTSQQSAFSGCSNMNISATDIGHFENVTNFTASWFLCTSLTSFPLIDTSSGTSFSTTWQYTDILSFPLLDTSSGTNFFRTWRNSNITLFPPNAFDNNIASNYNGSFGATKLTTQSIDDILVSLDTSGVSNGTFQQSGGQAPSATGIAAKDSLVAKGWTITYTA